MANEEEQEQEQEQQDDDDDDDEEEEEFEQEEGFRAEAFPGLTAGRALMEKSDDEDEDDEDEDDEDDDNEEEKQPSVDDDDFQPNDDEDAQQSTAGVARAGVSTDNVGDEDSVSVEAVLGALLGPADGGLDASTGPIPVPENPRNPSTIQI